MQKAGASAVVDATFESHGEAVESTSLSTKLWRAGKGAVAMASGPTAMAAVSAGITALAQAAGLAALEAGGTAGAIIGTVGFAGATALAPVAALAILPALVYGGWKGFHKTNEQEAHSSGVRLTAERSVGSAAIGVVGGTAGLLAGAAGATGIFCGYNACMNAMQAAIQTPGIVGGLAFAGFASGCTIGIPILLGAMAVAGLAGLAVAGVSAYAAKEGLVGAARRSMGKNADSVWPEGAKEGVMAQIKSDLKSGLSVWRGERGAAVASASPPASHAKSHPGAGGSAHAKPA